MFSTSYNTSEQVFWNKNFILLILSNVLLYISVYMLFPVLQTWIVGKWGYSPTGASLVSSLFGIALFLPGAVNNYLVDTFKRKSVCTRSIMLFALLGLLYPYADQIWMVYALRALQGALFAIALMVTGSTLVIDVTPSSFRSKANWVFAFSGGVGMLLGLSGGLYLSSIFSLNNMMYISAAFAGVALFLVSMIEICFRAPLEPPLFSFDRFILFRNIPPGINMMTVPFVLGTLVAGKPDYFFYLCIVLGFAIFWFIPKQIKRKADDIVRIVTGYIFITLSVYLVSSYQHHIVLCAAGVMMGLGVASAMCQYLKIMIKLPKHCERGTGYHTYQLMWEIGIMMGVALGFFVCRYYQSDPLTLAGGICMAGLLGYLLFTRRYYQKRTLSNSTIK